MGKVKEERGMFPHVLLEERGTTCEARVWLRIMSNCALTWILAPPYYYGYIAQSSISTIISSLASVYDSNLVHIVMHMLLNREIFCADVPMYDYKGNRAT